MLDRTRLVVRDCVPPHTELRFERLVGVRWSPRSQAGVLAKLLFPEALRNDDYPEEVGPFLGGTRATVAYVMNLYVPRRRRRQGLGSALMRAVLRAAYERGSRRALLIPERGSESHLIPFYERLGFRTLATFNTGETLMGRALRAPRRKSQGVDYRTMTAK